MKNVTSISGVPTWTMVFNKNAFLEITDKKLCRKYGPILNCTFMAAFHLYHTANSLKTL